MLSKRFTSAICTSLLLLTATSCGGGSGANANASLDAGYSSLNSGDHGAALGHFDTALAKLDAGSEEYVGAKVGQLQALAHTDAAKAKTELLALGTDSGVQARDYGIVVDELVKAATAQASDPDASKATITSALDILKAGKTNFPDYAKWDALVKKTGDQAQKIGSADMEALEGLGYVGGE